MLLLAWPLMVHATCDDTELTSYVLQQVSSGVLESNVPLDDSIREAYRGTCAMEQQIKQQKENIRRLNLQLSNAMDTEADLNESLGEYKGAFGEIEEISHRQNEMIKELIEDFDMYQRKQKAQYVVPAALGLVAGYLKYQGDENATALDVVAYGAAGFGVTLTLDQRNQLKVAAFVAKIWP